MHPQRVGWLLLVPVVVAVVFSWTRLALEMNDVPHDDDYVAAREALVANGFDRARDALVIVPPWSLRPLKVLGDFEPISGDAIAEQPLHRYARLWAIVEPDAEPHRDPLVERRGAPAWSKAVGSGRVVVERFDLPAPSVTFDLRARITDATVRIAGDEASARICDRVITRGRSRDPSGTAATIGVACGKDGWQRVTREWGLVSENADDVIWSHPPPAGSRLEIEWKDVVIGQSVVVRAGFTRDGADRAREPVRLRVLVDGELVGTVVRKPAFSFHTDIVDTEKLAGRTATLTLAVDSEDNAGAHYAWDAYVVGAPSEAGTAAGAR